MPIHYVVVNNAGLRRLVKGRNELACRFSGFLFVARRFGLPNLAGEGFQAAANTTVVGGTTLGLADVFDC